MSFDAYVFGGSYRDRCTGTVRFRVVNPFLSCFWESSGPLRVFTTETLPAVPMDRCHLYRITDPFCGSVLLVHENAEWADRIGAPGMSYLAEDEKERLYMAYCLFVGDGDHG